MNRNVQIILHAGFIALCCSAGWQAAQAQNQNQVYIDPGKLPRADRFYKHRPLVQVVNDRPEITSMPPGPEARKLMVINVPKTQAPGTEIIQVNAPGSGGDLPAGVVDLSSPPRSGFGQSNIPESGPLSMRNKLPAGQTSNGLLSSSRNLQGQFKPRGKEKLSAPLGNLLHAARPAATEPLVYDRGGTGTGGANAILTKSEVRGTLQRGALLDKTGK